MVGLGFWGGARGTGGRRCRNRVRIEGEWEVGPNILVMTYMDGRRSVG